MQEEIKKKMQENAFVVLKILKIEKQKKKKKEITKKS